MKITYPSSGALLWGVFLITILIYLPLSNSLPVGNHIWAKSDFLALAHGFICNGFDFFHPQTYQLNLQFPAESPPELFQGITSADFPIFPYSVALLSILFKGIAVESIFRFCTLIWSVFITTKIFLIGRKTDLGDKKALFLSLMVFLNPGQFIYQFGFTPSPVAFASSTLAIMYLYSAVQMNKHQHLYYSALFFTFATLIRTTHIIFLGAMGIMLLYRLIKGDKTVLKPLLWSVLGGLIVVSYYIYNAFLRQKYGSIFLGGTMCPNGLYDALLSIYMVIRRGVYYLPIPLVIILFWKFIELKRHKFRLNNCMVENSMLVFAIAALVVVLVFYIVMMQQFVHHDYYLLDTFTPLLFAIMILIFSIKELNFSNKQIVVFVVLMLGFGVTKLWRTVESSKSARGYLTSINFEGTASMLDSLNVGRSDKMLVIDAYAPNLPFIHMKRQGFLVLTTSKENIERALTWPFDYIITQNSFYESDVLVNFPEFEKMVIPIKNNGRITVWELSSKGKEIYPIRYKPESVRW